MERLVSLPSAEPVRGGQILFSHNRLIEGKLLWSGQPVVGAQITSCADSRISFTAKRPCANVIEMRTDAQCLFSFHQMIGVKPRTQYEVNKSPIHVQSLRASVPLGRKAIG